MMSSGKWFVALLALVLGTLGTQTAHAQTTNRYTVQVQSGVDTIPWRKDGTWVIGGRAKQSVVVVRLTTNDYGKTLAGTMTYKGEEPISVKATATGNNKYTVKVQWGGETAPWREDGTWVIGGRAKQSVFFLDVKSSDGGKTLAGTVVYEGEGQIKLRCVAADGYEGLAGSYKEKTGGEVKIRKADDAKKEAGPWRWELKGEGDWACAEGQDNPGEGKPTVFFLTFTEGPFKGQRYNIVRDIDGKVKELQLVGGSKAIWVKQAQYPSMDDIVKAKATYSGTLQQANGGVDWSCTATVKGEGEVLVKWSTGEVTYKGKMGPSEGKEGAVVVMNVMGSDKSEVRFVWISDKELQVEWWPNMEAKAGQKQNKPAHVKGTITKK